MRAAAPFQVTLRHFGAWHAMLWTWSATGVLAMVAWVVTHERPLAWWIPAIAGAAAPALLGLARALSMDGIARLAFAKGPSGDGLHTRRSGAGSPGISLRWDGKVWILGLPGRDPVPGSLGVAVDLGPWMLLRFLPEWPAQGHRTTWLPLQRHGLEDDWHALRCAVHTPAPRLGDTAMAAGRPGS